ncbi:MAG: DUF3540 domain-containing protein [Sandaracinaceae bacterium]
MSHALPELPLPTGSDTRVSTGAVVSVDGRGVRVRAAELGERVAQNAVAGSWEPASGDRVLLLSDGRGACFVVGVLSALRPAGSLDLGLNVEQDERGATHVTVPGDLHLSAPHGQIHIEGARGVGMRSERAVTIESHDGQASRSRLTLDGDAAEIRAGVFAAKAARLVALAEDVTTIATRVDAQVEELRTRAERIETRVGALVEHAKESYREVEGLSQTRVGRMRLVAKGQLSWLAERAKLKAKDVFAIDGESIHLG